MRIWCGFSEHVFKRLGLVRVGLEVCPESGSARLGAIGIAQHAQYVCHASGLGNRHKIWMVDRCFPTGFLDQLEMIVDLIDFDHGFDKALWPRYFREVGGHGVNGDVADD